MRQRRTSDGRSRRGRRENSDGWIRGAFSLTARSPLADAVVCIDDCERCPLFTRGCAAGCNRWDTFVCSSCPCLGSRYACETRTVDPRTGRPEPPDPALLRIREIRRSLDDGVPIDPE